MDNRIIGVFLVFVVLIAAHFGISRRAISSSDDDNGTMHWTYLASLVLSFMLLGAYLVVLGYLFYEDTAWPHVGSLSIFFFLLLCPGMLFQLFFLGYSLIKRKLPARRILVRVLSIVIGLLLGSQIPLYAQNIAMDHFIENYQPLLEAIGDNLLIPVIHKSPMGIRNLWMV